MGDGALCRDPVMLEMEFLILKTAQLHSRLHPQGSSSESRRITLKLLLKSQLRSPGKNPEHPASPAFSAVPWDCSQE